MGNVQSNEHLYGRVERIMPSSDNKLFGGSARPFSGSKDREQFIYAAITVLTQNGALLLGDHDIRLLYSRRPNDRVVARLVAEKTGVIRTKIEPSRDGRDQAEAFTVLKRDIEIRLDAILSEVPGDGSIAAAAPVKGEVSPASPSSPMQQSGGVAGRSGSGSVSRRPLAPAPGQRGDGGESETDRIMLHNEGPPAYGVAVREWKSGDEKKG